MNMRRPALAAEDGFSMYIVVMAMMVLLTLGAALSIAGHQSTIAISDDELGVRALQAAEAGAQAAVHRMNLQQPTDSQCITTTIATPQSGTAWCSTPPSQSVGNGASFVYQTSIPTTTGCTGSNFGSATVQRCIVATGTAGGITKRVVQRVVSSSGFNPFPVSGILGKDYVDLGNNTIVTGNVGSNGQVSLQNGANITDGVSLWSGAPNPTGFSGTVTRSPTPYVLSPPNMLNPDTSLNSSTSNDNGRLLAGASPSDSCSGGGGQNNTCYTDTSSSPRELNLGNQGSVTLGGGVYNFCQINLGQSASVNVATGAKILLYIDSPDRGTASGCKSGQGGISAGNNAIFSNPSGDPTALQIVIYGSSSFPSLQIPNNITLSAAIYAPNTTISFKNNGSFVGGISAKGVTIKNNAAWDTRLDNFHLATTLVYYRGAWRQCNSRVQSLTAPTTGCL